MIVCGGGHPDGLIGYIGPRELYDRYMAGEVVTRTDALFDQSEFVILPESEIGAENRRRLWWMIEHLQRIDGEVRRI